MLSRGAGQKPPFCTGCPTGRKPGQQIAKSPGKHDVPRGTGPGTNPYFVPLSALSLPKGKGVGQGQRGGTFDRAFEVSNSERCGSARRSCGDRRQQPNWGRANCAGRQSWPLGCNPSHATPTSLFRFSPAEKGCARANNPTQFILPRLAQGRKSGVNEAEHGELSSPVLQRTFRDQPPRIATITASPGMSASDNRLRRPTTRSCQSGPATVGASASGLANWKFPVAAPTRACPSDLISSSTLVAVGVTSNSRLRRRPAANISNCGLRISSTALSPCASCRSIGPSKRLAAIEML